MAKLNRDGWGRLLALSRPSRDATHDLEQLRG
jgi:hypothetical protein